MHEELRGWLRVLRDGDDVVKQREAAQRLATAVRATEGAARTARELKAAVTLTHALARTTDEQLLDALAAAVAGVSGALSCGKQARNIAIAGHTVSVVESSLSDGLGARLWSVSFMLCRAMAERPAVFAGAQVLELGAGVGLCGLYAARLGARTVTLTDCVPEVLSTLARSAAANHAVAHDGDGEGHEGGCGWDFGHVRVRHLDWDDEQRACEAEEQLAARREARESEGEGESGRAGLTEAVAEATTRTEQRTHRDADGRAPRLPSDESYALVLGSDVMYETAHAEVLPACISRRLAPHGLCIVALAIRWHALFEQFADSLARRGLRLHVHRLQLPPDHDLEGMCFKQGEQGDAHYAGGFNMLVIDRHAAPAPASDWSCLDWLTPELLQRCYPSPAQ